MKALLLVCCTLLLVACGSAPRQEVERAGGDASWVQFGTVEWVVKARIPSTADNQTTEEAMNLSIRLDQGDEVQVVQAVSRAGRFNVGDRVRVLQIGDFTQVTFWPYAKGQKAAEN